MRRVLLFVVCVVALAVGAGAVLVATGVVHAYRLTAASMEPTLHCAQPAPLCRAATADRVLVARYVLFSPSKGDLVAFHAPIRARAACGLRPGAVLIKRITKIAAGRYTLLGDNRGASCDSRVWGTVPRSSLIGRVFVTYWPLQRIHVR